MVIYIPRNASEVEKTAAEELSLWLGKVHRTEFPVQSEAGGTSGIYVGHTDFAAARGIFAEGGRNELNGAEAWRICERDGSLIVTGGRKNTDRGVIYAAEHYLEDVVGVRFWTATEEYVPEKDAFSVESGLELSGEPKMVMRSVTTGSFVGNDPVYMVRHRMNYSSLPEKLGGGVMFSPRGHCHTTGAILPPAGLYEQHPDWFAWSETLEKRLPYGQYCLNNEEFIHAFEEAFIADVARIYAECDKKGEPYPHHFHISLDDNDFDCECPLCRERMEKSGYTGNYLRFVNRIAATAKKVWPDILVETLAYWTYMDPPKDDTVPAENVPVRLANLDIDILHDLNHPNNKHGLEVLSRWSDICKKAGVPLYIWDYNVIYTATPTPNAYRLSSLYRTYADFGVQADYMENEECLLTDFWSLKQWLLIHLMEDPYADAGALKEDFMRLYYGPAAPALAGWLALEEKATQETGLRMCCVRNFIKADHIPYELYAEGLRLFDEAEASVQGDQDLTRRVRQARFSLDMAVCMRYDSLIYQAEKRGEVFPVTRDAAARRMASIIEETHRHLQPYADAHPGAGLPVWEGSRCIDQWLEPYKAVPLPEELAGTDAMQISLSDYAMLGSKNVALTCRRDEEALSGWAACLPYDNPLLSARDEMTVLPCGSKGHPYTMTLTHRGEAHTHTLSLEDLTPDEYALYPLFDIDDLSEDSDTNLRMVQSAFYLHISGLSVVFPGKKLSLLMRAKFSGAAYGGSASEPDMISFDRLYVIPRD